jgi:hypothetical protein
MNVAMGVELVRAAFVADQNAFAGDDFSDAG